MRSRPRHRAIRALGVLLVLVASCGAAPADRPPGAPAPVPAAAPPSVALPRAEPAWGVVDSTCAPERLAARPAGVDVAVVEAFWDRFEPTPDAVDAGYADGLRATVQRCLDAGVRVVLGSGLQYPPAWVRALPDAAVRDQAGRTPDTGAVDTVFSAAVAAAADGYLRRLVAAVPADRLVGIRLGTSTAGELGHPGPEASGAAFDSWWAFGPAPQHGQGLAPGQVPSPLPDWIPGQRTWQGRAVTPDQARSWFDWYSGALVRAVADRARSLRAAGYRGPVHVPAAGRGVLPAALDAAVAVVLDTAVRDGALRRGLDYVGDLPALAAAVPGAVVDLTGLDDATAVRARRLSPPQDRCRPGDAQALVGRDAVVDTWPNQRVTAAAAARAGLPTVGENPGPPGPTTGGTADSDSEADQLRYAVSYARGCGLSAFLLAFEDDLYTDRSGLTPADYEAAIGG
ncbi:beta-galactosidase [Actinomycetospora sp. NBRC 106378]|uniref:beta-galactosidase n=1 Tax=Actinomycetospora sp. NBRC 106378 TaxID=3032208 RepID=UPI0025565ECD|nr:beta-galactosidase [Actinomycetospora sp. NBRC 106378]